MGKKMRKNDSEDIYIYLHAQHSETFKVLFCLFKRESGNFM